MGVETRKKSFGGNMVEANEIKFTGQAIAICKFSWFEKYIPDFIQRRKLDVVELSQALNNSDFDRIAKICHQIRGSADSFGFPGLNHITTQLESAANSRDGELAKELILKLLDLNNWSMSC